MRIHSRLLLGMFGLALAIPAVAGAAPFGEGESYVTPGGTQAPQTTPHNHKGLFGRRHCVECQRAYVKAHDGVDVPAPPPIESGATMHGHVMAGNAAPCSVCQGNAVVTGPIVTADAHAPGYAVVGGGPGAMVSADAPGYAVVGDAPMGPDPAPIGISRSGQGAGGPRMAAMGPRPAGAGPYDPSVVPTAIPPAQVAMEGPGHNRPHIIGHLLGLPKFGQIRRGFEDREREQHAAISYDQPATKVSELPASMVYGKTGH